MSVPSLDPLLISIVAPLAVAAAIGLGLPKRWSMRLAYLGFGVPLLCALHVWWHFGAAPKADGYAFLQTYSTGLGRLGIDLRLGVNGIAMPLFVLAGIVGFAAGLYAIKSTAERVKIYVMLLLVMLGGLMGVFASVNLFYFYFFHELALIPTFIMIGVWGGRDRMYAAMQVTIYLTLGAMLSLLGLIAIYARSGAHSFDLIALHAALAREPLGLLGAEAHLRPAALRLWHPGLALALPQLGAPGLRRRAQFGGDAPRRRAEEVRPVRPDPGRAAAAARRARPPGATRSPCSRPSAMCSSSAWSRWRSGT